MYHHALNAYGAHHTQQYLYPQHGGELVYGVTAGVHVQDAELLHRLQPEPVASSQHQVGEQPGLRHEGNHPAARRISRASSSIGATLNWKARLCNYTLGDK